MSLFKSYFLIETLIILLFSEKYFFEVCLYIYILSDYTNYILNNQNNLKFPTSTRNSTLVTEKGEVN
jgi:hypothetical protein